MSASVNSYLDKFDSLLDQDYAVNRYLDIVQQKTNIKKRYIALAIIVIVGGWLVYGYAADLLCNLIGFVYPAYVSVKAIESADKDDDTEWLMYWVVFAVFSLIEFFSDILLSWFPFYYLGKCVFLLWCMSPFPWNGSKLLYHRLIKPFILQHENKIDATLNVAKEKAKQAVGAGIASGITSSQATELIENVIGDKKSE